MGVCCNAIAIAATTVVFIWFAARILQASFSIPDEENKRKR
jgi:hypothetical protein